MTSWAYLYGADPDYPAQTVEQQYAHALADRLEERAERYAAAARSAARRAGGRPYHSADWPTVLRAVGLSDYYTTRARRLRTAARVVREEADR